MLITLSVIFAFIGISGKITDDLVDEYKNSELAFISGIICGMLVAIASFLSPAACIVCCAEITGCLLLRKIDNKAFYILSAAPFIISLFHLCTYDLSGAVLLRCLVAFACLAFASTSAQVTNNLKEIGSRSIIVHLISRHSLSIATIVVLMVMKEAIYLAVPVVLYELGYTTTKAALRKHQASKECFLPALQKHPG